MFALVDCNNFYASCERVFNPALVKKPIVILSNNDGCVISRSNEAKKLGIPMGAPFFKWANFFKKNNVYVFSSNYSLYGDFSNRVMLSLKWFCPDIEIYSIDEAFLQLTDIYQNNHVASALHIKEKIKQWTGIPVSIGIAQTKTLAKLANHIAKKKIAAGIFDLACSNEREKIIANFPVENVWGVGKRTAIKLKEMNIHTAKELRDSNEKLMRIKFSVVMEKLVMELRGISCLPLEDIKNKKQIMSSRSFGKPVTDLEGLEEAVSHYTSLACVKLRNQKSFAAGVSVFIRTNFLNKNDAQYGNSISLEFPEATDDTRVIIKSALNCLRRLYKKGYHYKKAGIGLFGLINNVTKQLDIFSTKPAKNNSLMKVFDHVNKVLGKNTIFICSEGIKKSWQSISNRRSPRYTTRWNELAKVFCKED